MVEVLSYAIDFSSRLNHSLEKEEYGNEEAGKSLLINNEVDP